MHIIVFALALAVNFSFNLYSMEKKQQRGIVEKILHTMNKHADPFSYITDNESITHCEATLALLKNPTDSKYKKFERNQEWLGLDGHIYKVEHRQNRLISEVEKAIFGYYWYGCYYPRDDAKVEQIMKAYEIVPEIFSPHILALLSSYSQQKITKNEMKASTFQAFISLQQPVATSEQPIKNSDHQQYLEQITYESFRELVLNDNNESYFQGITHYLKKNSDHVGYLTNQKTRVFGEQLLRYNPKHPGHSDRWNLDPDMPLHRLHAHKVIQREEFLNKTIAGAINDDDYSTVMILSPFNPQKPNQVTISDGYFSPAIKALIKGYLAKKADETSLDFQILLESKKSKCDHQKLVQDCEICKKTLAEAQNSLPNCKCTPPKLLKDCPTCLELQKKLQSAPVTENSFLNVLDDPCNCQTKIPLKDCKQCLVDKCIQLSLTPGSQLGAGAASSIKTSSSQQKNDSNNTADNESSK